MITLSKLRNPRLLARRPPSYTTYIGTASELVRCNEKIGGLFPTPAK